MATPQQLRQQLVSAYPKSPWWKERVAKMSDKQVIAILIRLRLNGTIKI